MAGNFWQSSHFQQWLLDRQDLLRERHQDLQIFPEEEYQKVMIFFANFKLSACSFSGIPTCLGIQTSSRFNHILEEDKLLLNKRGHSR
ncbi:hypothetical protein AVEN_141124-1 [Araneus ventricosus]|uniref:Uncharacterized protein n=1 Tax=Araneus ventricosus TaxID=182803 RepID=A0A4Y2K9R4_ARAVE|nr:hypothetical protein AVEN_141124-1 [Araneus ventricosus]